MRLGCAGGTVLALALLGPRWLAAQGAGGTITGTVARANGLTPIVGAQVHVEGTPEGSVTNNRGHFDLANLAGTEVTLDIRALGFRSERRVVPVGARNVQIVLTESAAKLDQIVVTGTPEAESRKTLGNAVSEIDVANTLPQTGATDIGSVLNGRAAGVDISNNQGIVGSGPDIYIRGISTMNLNSAPLLYIDGVRVANDVGSGPQVQGGGVVSRLNDIDPQDIESIEIIKGPAAATIYGTEASNGVIQIITKHGVSGRPIFDVQGRVGADWLSNQTGIIPTNYALGPGDSILTFNGAKVADESGTPLFRTGSLQGLTGDVSGGTTTMRYRLGGNYDYDNGIDRNNVQRRLAGNSNAVYSPSPRLDVTTDVNVVHNHVNVGTNYGQGPLFDALYGTPLLASSPTQGYLIAPPSVYNTGVFANTQDVTHWTVGVTVNNRPTDWFSHRFIVGFDQSDEFNQGLSSYMPPYVAQFFPGYATGENYIQQRELQYTTLDYSATFTAKVARQLQSMTSVGTQYYVRTADSIDIFAKGFPGPGVSAPSAAALNQTTGDHGTNTTLGVYGQEQLNWRDKVFLTGAVRVDNNSAFGSNFKWVTYPKVSGSWVVSDESFWTLHAIDKLQLRAAFGESGTQPPVNAALRLYQGTPGANGQPSESPYQPGNPNLQPERGEETELGFTGSLFTRVGIDFTYYTRNTINEILTRSDAPSLGFPGPDYFNAGSVYSHGLELQATAQVLRGDKVALDVFANVSTANDEITKFGGLGPQVVNSAVPIQYNELGYPIASYFAQKVLSATMVDGVATNAMCDGGPSVGHRPVPCADAPPVFLGSPIPTVIGSGGISLTLFRRLRLYTSIDFRGGNKLFDGDSFNRCVGLGECLVNVEPNHFDPAYVYEVQNGSSLGPIDRFISDDSFAKLREVSASYTFPESWAHAIGASNMSITLAARNLHTWTSFTGLDPESRAAPGTLLAFNQAVIPIPSQFLTTVNVTF
jgi:TonB-dependent SusC/RagA subfamily outer membrane receptor